MAKNIELELRAEVTPKILDNLTKGLRREGKFISQTRRLSVCFFGEYDKKEIDVRVRITNGASEVVIKRGGFHAHDRIEVSQLIVPEQFMGMVKLFGQFFNRIKVMERTTQNFDFGNAIKISLVKADSIAYVEIEKMTKREHLKRDRRELIAIAENLQLRLVDSKEAFDELCDRLTRKIDWSFNKSQRHYAKLGRLLRRYSVASK